jgi:hypothetical protein
VTTREANGQERGARPLMSIQVGARSFADEGVPQVLDVLQERAGVNAIHFAAFTYTRCRGACRCPRRLGWAWSWTRTCSPACVAEPAP